MIILVVIATVVALVVTVILQSSNLSILSFEAVVQENVTMMDGENCLIVKRTTEIDGNPQNSLHIGKETKYPLEICSWELRSRSLGKTPLRKKPHFIIRLLMKLK